MGASRPAPAHPDAMTEAAFQAQVIAVGNAYGWRAYHTHDSRRSAAGFPDLVLSNPRQRRVIFAELKAEGGRTSDAQVAWLRSLADSGAETALWRPSNLEDVKAVLAGRRITQWAGA